VRHTSISFVNKPLSIRLALGSASAMTGVCAMQSNIPYTRLLSNHGTLVQAVSPYAQLSCRSDVLMRRVGSLVQDEGRHSSAQTAVAAVGHVEIVAVEHAVERHFS
jgi:hypothetical protein